MYPSEDLMTIGQNDFLKVFHLCSINTIHRRQNIITYLYTTNIRLSLIWYSNTEKCFISNNTQNDDWIMQRNEIQWSTVFISCK